MQPKMPFHCLKGSVRLGDVPRLFIMNQNIVSEEVIIYPLWEAKIAIVLSPVEPPKFLYGVGIARADCNDARDRMRECFVGHQGQTG